jgi:hypothetical protein
MLAVRNRGGSAADRDRARRASAEDALDRHMLMFRELVSLHCAVA